MLVEPVETEINQVPAVAVADLPDTQEPAELEETEMQITEPVVLAVQQEQELPAEL